MHRNLLIAVVAAIVLFLLLAVGVLAYDHSQRDEIASGIKIGGVNVGGRSEDSARKVIKAKVVAPLQQPVQVTYQGKSYTLGAKQLHETADVNGMVQEAVDRSRQGSIFDRVARYATGGDVNANLEPRVGFDEGAVKNFVNQLSDAINQDPVDASVVPTDGGTKLVKHAGQAGLEIDKGATTDAIDNAVRSPGRDQPVQPVVKETKPHVTTADLPNAYARYIVINRETFTLRFFHDLKLQRSYTVAVGQQGLETPAGLYHAQDKQVDPVWQVPNSAWAGSLAGQTIPPGPEDPLKARWIGIFNGAGIHGTDEVSSLGHAFSHGCVRMSIPDVIDLYNRVRVGDPIYIL